MKIGIVINARLGSKRLPKKHVRDIAGKLAIEQLIDRLTVSLAMRDNRGLSLPIIIATGNEKENKDLGPVAARKDVSIIYGDQNNIPNRHLQTAQQYNLDAIVSVDGDDLLTSPEALWCAIEDLAFHKAGLARSMGLPLGMNILWSYTVETLIKAAQKAPADGGSFDTGWGWIFKDMVLTTAILEVPDASKIRATLDYPEDLKFFRAVYSLCPKELLFDDKKVCRWIVSNRICNINKKYIL